MSTMYHSVFEGIKALTEVNSHTMAYIEGVELLIELGCELDTTLVALRRIEATRDRLGHLPIELYIERYTHYTRMMDAAKEVLDEETYNTFHMLF